MLCISGLLHSEKAQSYPNVRRYQRGIVQSYEPPKILESPITTMSPSLSFNTYTHSSEIPLAVFTGIMFTILGFICAMVWICRAYMRILLALVRGHLIAFRDSGLGPHQIRVNVELAHGDIVDTLHYSTYLVEGTGTTDTQADASSISAESDYLSTHSNLSVTLEPLTITDEDDIISGSEVQNLTPRLIG